MSQGDQADGGLARAYGTGYPVAVAGALGMVLLAIGWTLLDRDANGEGLITLAIGGLAVVVLAVLLVTRLHRDRGWSIALQVLALATCAAMAGQVGLVGAGLFAAVAALLLFLAVVLGTVLRADTPTRPRGSAFD